MKQNELFANYFYAKKIIDKSEYQNILSRLDEEGFDCLSYLRSMGLINEKDRIEALSNVFDLPFIDLDYITVSNNFEKYFDVELLRRYSFVPIYFSNDDSLIIGASNPNNPDMRSAIETLYDGKVEYVLVEKQKIRDFLDSYQANMSTKDALDSIAKNLETVDESEDESDLYVQNAPAVKFVDSIIKEAIPLRASDIHIEPAEEKVVIRYRIDGNLVKWTEFPISSYPEISARIKILSNIDISEKRIPQDGRIILNIGGEDVNFRVSTLPTIHGEKFVIRILDNKIFSYSIRELDFAKNSFELIEKILKHPHGIILLTGPTGSGKTTTLYAFLRELNNGKKNIVTIEDPVEYAMEGVNQLQINNKANLTFASSLRSILRQDPDIIMVGEIRDEETAQIATRAAITGHLVLSTLHTNDAVGAVVRLVDMGIPEYLVSDALVAVISQRLVKRLCPYCREKVKTSVGEMKVLNLKKAEYIYKPHGCPYCNHSGYKGRIAVHEIMYLDSQLKAKINSKENDIETLKQLALDSGMITLAEACKQYVLDGTTSLDEYLSVTLGD